LYDPYIIKMIDKKY